MIDPTRRRDDVELIERATVYQGRFRIDRYRLRHRLFAGGWSAEITREVFERGHAVVVLPYDPVRDEVVLVEQFRAGPYAAGDDPWQIEVVAGIIEPGETAEQVARRELAEEANLAPLGPLEPICRCYASPGGSSECFDIFCARVDASGAGGIHGLQHEHEDIRVRVVGFAEAMQALARGRVRSAPPIVALQWLALNRERLRREWR
jgi:ADP-ribose pyrophosphatase